MKLLPYIVTLCCLPCLISAQVDARIMGALPTEVQETSGLVFYGDKLITHNDSGNEPLLFEIDTTTRQLIRTINILNAVNTDWEDIAQDNTYFYIGDFGNNNGNRQDLGVYRINKSDYDSEGQVTADRISFSYEDQTDFSVGQNSDWDAEALIVYGDSLVIFTKQWQSRATVAYSIPRVPGSYVARRMGEYDVNGLVTGATYNTEGEEIFLCGYSQALQPFVLRLSEFPAASLFDGIVEKTSLDVGFAQVEGITHVSIGTYLFSSERFVNTSPSFTLVGSLFKFTTGRDPVEEPPEVPPEVKPPTEEPAPAGPESVVIYSAFGSKEVNYVIESAQPLYGWAIFDLSGKRILRRSVTDSNSETIDLSFIKSSVYYITFYLQGKVLSRPFYLY